MNTALSKANALSKRQLKYNMTLKLRLNWLCCKERSTLHLISIVNLFFCFQFCYVCDPTRPDKRHPPEYAVDGMETWWQSPPLSRGMKYNEVNLTIDLGQV